MADRPSPAAQALIEVLQPHTPFAEAIVRRQAERAGLRLAEVTPETASKLSPMIAQAASTFLDPSAMHQVRTALKVK